MESNPKRQKVALLAILELITLAIIFISVLIRLMIENKLLWAILNFSLPALAYLLLLKTGKIFHLNGVFAAPDFFTIKFFAGFITLVFVVAALALMGMFASMLSEQEAEA